MFIEGLIGFVVFVGFVWFVILKDDKKESIKDSVKGLVNKIKK